MNPRPGQSQFFKTVGSVACLLAVLAMLGGHWVALQSFAWARMISQYSRQGSLVSAIAKTFDGRHPCALCLIVQHSRQQDQREHQDLPLTKLGEGPDLFCDLPPALVPSPFLAAIPAIPFVPQWHLDFLDSPPTPPPRAA